MSVISLIKSYDNAVKTFNTGSNPLSIDTIFRRAMWMSSISIDINKQLSAYREALDKGIIIEPFYNSFWEDNDQNRQLKGTILERSLIESGDVPLNSIGLTLSYEGQPITYIKDFINVIESANREMNLHLEAIQNKIQALHPDAYGRYYLTHKAKFDMAAVMKKYARIKLKYGVLTFDILKAIQTEIVANALKDGIMNHDYKTIGSELQHVDVERVMQNLPDGYEVPADFNKRCAKFRRYITWDGDILKIDYNKYGNYICRCLDKFTDKEFDAIFELDMMLYLIHQDMVKYRPELAAHLSDNEDSDIFGIVFTLTRMFQQCQKDLVTDKKYDAEWMESLFRALLHSEHRDTLLSIWQNERKRDRLKGQILGCLKYAGIIGGSNMDITRAVKVVDESKFEAFSVYVGEGNNHGISIGTKKWNKGIRHWINDYVNR